MARRRGEGAMQGFYPAVTRTVLPKQVFTRLLSYNFFNMQGIGSRERQEDYFTQANARDVTKMRTEGLLALVADGMGGMEDGQTASRVAANVIRQDFLSYLMDGDIAGQMRESVFHADAEVYQCLHGNGGSTVVMCVFYQEQMYFCSVGDSYIYLFRDGVLLRVNQAQNRMNELYQYAIRSGSMDPQEARINNEGEALVRFVGMGSLGSLDVDSFILPLKLMDEDVILLCSDGVGDALTEAELSRCLEGTPADACADMEEMILEKNDPYQDNYTALVIRCGY